MTWIKARRAMTLVMRRTKQICDIAQFCQGSRAMLLKPGMILTLIASLVLVALVHPVGAFQIRRVATGAGVVLKLRGDVRAGDYERLKTILQNGSVAGLEIRSGGGSLQDGFDIARVVRDKGLIVYASKECELGVRLHPVRREAALHRPE